MNSNNGVDDLQTRDIFRLDAMVMVVQVRVVLVAADIR